MSRSAIQRLQEYFDRLQADAARVEEAKELASIVESIADTLTRLELTNRRYIDQIARAVRLSEIGAWSASLVHDLRQPLLGIKGFAELIRQKAGQGSIREWSEEVLLQVSRLQEIIGSVEAHLRLDSESGIGKTALASVPEAVREALSLFSVRHAKWGVSVDCAVGPELASVSIQPVHLVQILSNLIDNASIAVRESGDRTVRISATEHGGEVRIWITNHGPAIPTDLHERIFEPFFTDQEQGTGLGLFISRQLARHAGGDLALVDPASLGWQTPPAVAFQIRLPSAAGTQPGAPAGRGLDRELHRFVDELEITQRVLAVDDEAVVTKLLLDYMASRQILADGVSTAEEALERLGERDYALAVIDKNLPGIDGIELLRRVKAQWPDIEVLLITAYASVDSALEAIAEGAYDYIPKPFPSLSYVGEKVRAALAKYDFEQRARRVISFLSRSCKEVDQGDQTGSRLQHILAEYEQGPERGVVLVRGPAGLAHSAEKLGFQVERSFGLDDTLARVRSGDVDAVVWVESESGPGPGPAEAVRTLREADAEMAVFVVGRESDLSNIVGAIGEGVGDYLLRPLEGRELFGPRLERLLRRRRLVRRYRNLTLALKQLNVNLASSRD
ncbi:MAG: response regulator [Deltaproteobacteria bacterium]|nr:response regulator [Deltaproteobacteria bacterium]